MKGAGFEIGDCFAWIASMDDDSLDDARCPLRFRLFFSFACFFPFGYFDGRIVCLWGIC